MFNFIGVRQPRSLMRLLEVLVENSVISLSTKPIFDNSLKKIRQQITHSSLQMLHTHTQWTGHLTQMGKTSKAYKNLAVQHEGRHQSGLQGIGKS